MTFLGEVEVAHGGFEAGVPQGDLDEAEVDASFEQRGGVRMSEGMDSQAGFGNPGALFGCAEGTLDAVSAHGKSGGRTLFLIPPGGRKEPGLVAVGSPVSSKQSEGICGQGDIAVFSAFASVDMDDHTLRVNVGNLKVEGFMEPKSQAIDSGEVDLIVRGCGWSEEPPDLLKAEDGRKTVFGLGANEWQGVPVALEDVLGEEPNATVADAHGSGGEVVNVFTVQEVVLKLGFGDEVGGFAKELREQADLTDIGFLSTFALATELKRGNHLLTQWGHETSPFLSWQGVCLRRQTW
jgi:hypothetical protein